MLRSALFGELIRAAALDTARATLPQQEGPMSRGAYLRRGMRGAIELRGRV
jgi:hypothetical protein